MTTQYFRHLTADHTDQFRTDFRFRLALDLIRHFGVVAAKPGAEDSSGRSILELQTPKEVVDRAFEMAAYAVEKAEALDWLKPFELTDEQLAEIAVELESVKAEAQAKLWGSRKPR
jgi:hypothetical protein